MLHYKIINFSSHVFSKLNVRLRDKFWTRGVVSTRVLMFHTIRNANLPESRQSWEKMIKCKNHHEHEQLARMKHEPGPEGWRFLTYIDDFLWRGFDPTKALKAGDSVDGLTRGCPSRRLGEGLTDGLVESSSLLLPRLASLGFLTNWKRIFPMVD